MTLKAPPSASTATSAVFGRRADLGRQITREHIDAHMAAFEAAGGVVERLGNTPLRVPQRDAATAKPKSTAP